MIVGQPEYFAARRQAAAGHARARAAATTCATTWSSLCVVPEAGRSTRSISASTARCCPGQKEQRAALEARARRRGQRDGHGARQDLRQGVFPGSRQAALRRDSVEAIRDAYRERIAQLDWMSDATKAKARAEARRDHAEGRLSGQVEGLLGARRSAATSYAANMMNAARWRFDDDAVASSASRSTAPSGT